MTATTKMTTTSARQQRRMQTKTYRCSDDEKRAVDMMSANPPTIYIARCWTLTYLDDNSNRPVVVNKAGENLF
eukprot:scaffold400812_cov19-Prasinocladus_malaysianus.AAC.1